ncbi:glycoside hydrolase family 27 protein [Enterococcus sp. AZ072]|uniref:glycoside hydrolase family 27 protein n=1 Tax=unclassified Enterococcus TaxID=2608891 RepID=UPI003D2D94AC
MRNLRNFAKTPPKGWNSWDVYGASVTEEEVRRNAVVMATKLKQHGWDYVVVDIQWYEPGADSAAYHVFAPLNIDEFSRVMPAENRFPSVKDGNGFKSLGDYIHSLGLKFGIHILRGIPREAVHKRMNIKGSDKTADQIAVNSICPWNSDMYGVDVSMPEGQLYYDSLLEMYAEWGVDFIKVDDIAYSTIYREAHLAEITAIRKAIDKTGREIVLSLSPGPARLQDGSFLQENANMWRLTDDFWDDWELLYDMFDRCNYWSPFIKPGNWPDCDMLPLGHIGIRSGERGMPDRMTNFTKPEQKTMITLWSIFQSPLMFGGELADLDEWTLGLLTNEEINAMHTTLNKQKQEFRNEEWIVWSGENDQNNYIAIFNVSNTDQAIPLDLMNEYISMDQAIELWSGDTKEMFDNKLESHGCAIFKL